MGWKATTGRRQQVMVSIVSTLLALAALAEKSAGDTPWVRFCVLWAARQADLIAREYVAGSTWNTAGRLWSPALPNVRYGTEPSDALDIAASLRALAEMVSGMATYLRRVSVWRQGQASGEGGHFTLLRHGLVKRLPDTALAMPPRVDASRRARPPPPWGDASFRNDTTSSAKHAVRSPTSHGQTSTRPDAAHFPPSFRDRVAGPGMTEEQEPTPHSHTPSI